MIVRYPCETNFDKVMMTTMLNISMGQKSESQRTSHYSIRISTRKVTLNLLLNTTYNITHTSQK